MRYAYYTLQVKLLFMNYLPLFHNVKNKRCIIVGDGVVAQRKAETLKRAGAQVIIQKIYNTKEFERAYLIIAATDDEAVNQQVSQDAQARGVLVNVVDNPQLSNVIFPAIVDRSPMIIAVSSGGAAPVLTRMLRAKLETLIPAAYGQLAHLAGEFRQAIKEKFATFVERRRFWEAHFEGAVAELVFSGKEKQARDLLERQLISTDAIQKTGEVYLVGAGPGDPDLLTFRALRLMQRADIVLYDRLIPQGILDLVRRDAEYIYVGKKAEEHTLPQEEINQLLIHYAQQGKRVCRLKGGDPFIFGRGGEEIAGLMAAGIPFQVVPGITAASGCACYAGIPLTHRDYAQSVQFLTGHLKADAEDYDWPALVRQRQTLVFYMGFNKLQSLCEQLLKHGMSAHMPIALIQQGTTPQQKVITGELKTFWQVVQQQAIQPPTLIIVGEVVKLHDQLNWFSA